MAWFHRFASGRRRTVARISALTATVLALVAVPSAAHAGDGPWIRTQYSGCVKSWSYNPYGAQARAVINYDAYRVTSTKYRILFAKSWVDRMADCGPKGADVKAYKIYTTTEFLFEGTNLSCTAIISSPSGFSCTVVGDDVRISETATCGNYVLACLSTFGQFDVVAKSGSSFSNFVWARTTIKLQRDDGQQHIWSTEYV